ncbi:hypothetical protein KXS07_00915 [Inquilinus limosus]|uniref:alpha/beta hydrolase domain-containing protein n=1 Tax=Inquilinus limosus TaxID=171674 RepID=UPI003F16DE9A
MIGPVASEGFSSPMKNYTFYASDIALASRGYVEQEFFLEGTANTYDTPTTPPATPPTALARVVTPGVPYRTRMVVRRPADPARFNGTVVVEWLNVTDGFDGEYFWVQSHAYLMRAGYAYIGVSAQDNGISNPKTGLKTFSPARYGSLDVTGGGSDCCAEDKLSYDIFSQAAKAAIAVPAVLNGLAVRNAIGVGMSQSGSRLSIYANSIHMRAPIYDALLMQVSNRTVRDDLPTPLIKVLSESEAKPDSLVLAQPDTPTRKSYWIAGTTHGDATQRTGRNGVRLRDLGVANTPNDACGPDGATPTRNRTPLRHVLNAAVHHLKRQVEQGTQPPSGAPFRRAGDAADAPLLRDEMGNVVGGIRLAHMEAPTARTDGIECGNIGAWVPFTTQQLQALYPTHEAYVAKVKAAVAASVAAGFVLPEDAAETIAEAEASVVGTGLTCGALCLARGHYRLDASSTGLLRETTVYYDILDGRDLVDAVDAAHRFAAEGDSATGPAAAQYRALAANALRRYLRLLEAARSDGRVTDTAADVLSMQAEAIIGGLAR